MIAPSAGAPVAVDTRLRYKEAKEDFERRYLASLLEQCGDNVTRAAELSGIVRQNLQKKIRQFNIPRQKHARSGETT
jgi:DNA-binding NtrC family response regulator